MKRSITNQEGDRKIRSGPDAVQHPVPAADRPVRPGTVLSAMPSWTRYIDSRMKQFAAGR